jgi:hypothetical protein
MRALKFPRQVRHATLSNRSKHAMHKTPDRLGSILFDANQQARLSGILPVMRKRTAGENILNSLSSRRSIH